MGLRLLGKGHHRLASAVVKDGRPNSETYAWFESSGVNSGLSNTGLDFTLNAAQESTDSPMEVLKQAMLHHEVMFRNQVLELHRLYWTQKNLMNDLCWRDFDKNAVSTDNQIHNWRTEMDSFMVDSPVSCLHRKACGDSDSDELELTLGNKKQGNNERKGDGKILRGKDCCLSSKDTVNLENSGAFKSNEDVSIVSSFNCHSHITDSACMPSAHVPAIPCATFTGRTRKEAIHRPYIYHPNADHGKRLFENSSLYLDFGWHEFGGCLSTNTVNQKLQPTSSNPRSFDLNMTQFESSSEISQNEVYLPSSASSSTIPSGNLMGPHAHTVAPSTSLRELSNKSLEGTSDALQTGNRNSASVHSQAKETDFLIHSYGLHACARQASTKKLEFAECAENNNQEEENLLTLRFNSEYVSMEEISGSSHGNGLVSADESPSLSPSGLYRLTNEDADLGFLGCNMQNESKNTKTTCTIDEKRCKLHHSIESSNIPQNASTHSEPKQTNREKSEEAAVSSSQRTNLMSVEEAMSVPLEEIQDEHNGADLIEEKLEHNERNKACSRNNDEVEGHSISSMNDNIQANEVSLAVTEKCTGRQEVITEADDHVALHEKSCSCSESTDKSLEKKEEHAVEIDSPIWRAAESLIHISLRNAVCASENVANIGPMEMENEEKSDQPQNSSDSLESIVLMLTETANDEFSMPTMITEEETEKGTRFKLKKGRGLHDFQREVLPSLVSLSRHEICEDLHTIAEAVRLHELSYDRPKKLSRGHWFTPVSSRRSRLSCVGKRR